MTLADKSDMEILAIADPIMDNLLEGSTEIDHEKHTRDFTRLRRKPRLLNCGGMRHECPPKPWRWRTQCGEVSPKNQQRPRPSRARLHRQDEAYRHERIS